MMPDRFIEKYGTHIIVGLSIGGHDVVLVRQDKSSNVGSSELKKHLDDLGDQLFSGTCNFTPKARDHKSKVTLIDPLPYQVNLLFVCLRFFYPNIVLTIHLGYELQPPQAFNVFDPQPVAFDSFSSVSKTKDVCSTLANDHF